VTDSADPAAYPDMDAIRAAHDAPRPREMPHPDGGSAAIERFLRSLAIDYEKWHDGVGYDVDALREATLAERTFAESQLDATRDWRDIDALAVLAELGSVSAEHALRGALRAGSHEIRLAVLRFAPNLVEDLARTELLLHALEGATITDGLVETISQVASFHPPTIVDALWRGLTTRPGDVAVHYAALLAFIYGRAESTFDWSLRPLYLKFNTPSADERRAALAELRTLVGAEQTP
jgi:hypothetical protein